MFGLQQSDLACNILGCGDGPAAFNAGMHQRGYRATSVDPLYGFDRSTIEQRIHDTYDIVLGQTRSNHHLFRWLPPVDSVAALGRIRLAAMREFLEDYDAGRAEQRYVDAELPSLPFTDAGFDLVLCSHLLFLYTDNLDLDFHLRSIDEMLRVGREVRIFPILDTNARTSSHLTSVMNRYDQCRSV